MSVSAEMCRAVRLGTHVAKPPSDSTFRLLLAQLDVEGFEGLLQ